MARKFDRAFGRNFEGMVVTLEPVAELWQKLLYGLLVADEVVVDEIDMAAIPEPVERVELGQHLRIRLGARHAAVEFDDVAEFAGEGAAARKLQANVEIVLELQEVETRDRR